MTPSRRAFLGGSIAVAGAASFLGYRLLTKPNADARWLLIALLEQTAVPDPLAVGRAFLSTQPQSTEETLLEAVFEHIDAGDAGRLVASFDRQRRREFDDGEVVTAAGWRIARIEAQLCALIALCHG